MANIDYVTSHQGQAHITTQNVIDLLAGLSGDVSGIKKFPQLYNGLSHEITDALTIQVKTGAALAGGSFFILGEAFDWMLDPGAVGYSRIDVLYVVMSEDPDTAVQSCDFAYEVGNLYPNGTTGTVPSAPTGTNITATYPFLRMDMTDGSIVSVTDYSTPYLSNSSLVTTVNELVEQLEESVGGTVEQVQTNTNEIAQMKVTFQDGVDSITDALSDIGITTAESTPTAIAEALENSNLGAWTGATTGEGNVSIPKGFHNGLGYVSGSGAYNSGRTQGRTDKQSEVHAVSGTVLSNDGFGINIRLYVHATSDDSSPVILTINEIPGLSTSLNVGARLMASSVTVAHSYKGVGTLA